MNEGFFQKQEIRPIELGPRDVFFQKIKGISDDCSSIALGSGDGLEVSDFLLEEIASLFTQEIFDCKNKEVWNFLLNNDEFNEILEKLIQALANLNWTEKIYSKDALEEEKKNDHDFIKILQTNSCIKRMWDILLFLVDKAMTCQQGKVVISEGIDNSLLLKGKMPLDIIFRDVLLLDRAIIQEGINKILNQASIINNPRIPKKSKHHKEE